MTLPLAHAGHWIANLLYAAPVFVVVGALTLQRARDKREARAGEGQSDKSEPPNRDDD